jgi:hypothetical protein
MEFIVSLLGEESLLHEEEFLVFYQNISDQQSYHAIP